jgi:Uncharacterized conserved protein containing a ferredoxin-like domain
VVHKTKEQVADIFRDHHDHLNPERDLTAGEDLVSEARTILRKKYFEADVGITGANFLIAETGSTVIVTNEGNGDLTQALPDTHVVVSSIEKVVPTLEDATTMIRLLGRSATGQDMSSYTTFSTGPKRSADRDGPKEFHVVLLDNGRSQILGSKYRDILRCIRCAACIESLARSMRLVWGTPMVHLYGASWFRDHPAPLGIEAITDLSKPLAFLVVVAALHMKIPCLI